MLFHNTTSLSFPYPKHSMQIPSCWSGTLRKYFKDLIHVKTSEWMYLGGPMGKYFVSRMSCLDKYKTVRFVLYRYGSYRH